MRVETRADVTSADNPLRALVYEKLTALDENGRAIPGLAVSWEAQNGDRRWQFTLRRNVRFHDGTPLTAAAVVSSLTAGGCESCPWTSLRAGGETVTFDLADARPKFPAELAQSRFAIQLPKAGAAAAGTGPFIWGAPRGPVQVLEAYDDYWGGRPYLNTIEWTPARSSRDQLVDLDLGRTDAIDIAPDQMRRVNKGKPMASSPAELIAVVVRTGKAVLQDLRVRQALALSVDRAPIQAVVLQKQGEVAGGLLPNWISGYASLLPTARDLGRAQQLVHEFGAVPPPLTIAVAEPDPVLQLIAERVALNARECGITVQATADREHSDLLVVRRALPSINPEVALGAMSESFGPRVDPAAHSSQRLYEEERQMVSQALVIPLAWIPRACAIGGRVHNWSMTGDGRWRLESVWLDATEPSK